MSLADCPPEVPQSAESASEQHAEQNGSANRKRFDIFVIDVGWNSPISESFAEPKVALPHQQNCNSYFLSAQQCFAWLASTRPCSALSRR